MIGVKSLLRILLNVLLPLYFIEELGNVNCQYCLLTICKGWVTMFAFWSLLCNNSIASISEGDDMFIKHDVPFTWEILVFWGYHQKGCPGSQ